MYRNLHVLYQTCKECNGQMTSSRLSSDKVLAAVTAFFLSQILPSSQQQALPAEWHIAGSILPQSSNGRNRTVSLISWKIRLCLNVFQHRAGEETALSSMAAGKQGIVCTLESKAFL